MSSGCPRSEHFNASVKNTKNAVHRIFSDFNMNLQKSVLHHPGQENIQ